MKLTIEFTDDEMTAIKTADAMLVATNVLNWDMARHIDALIDRAEKILDGIGLNGKTLLADGVRYEESLVHLLTQGGWNQERYIVPRDPDLNGIAP